MSEHGEEAGRLEAEDRAERYRQYMVNADAEVERLRGVLAKRTSQFAAILRLTYDEATEPQTSQSATPMPLSMHNVREWEKLRENRDWLSVRAAELEAEVARLREALEHIAVHGDHDQECRRPPQDCADDALAVIDALASDG